MRDEGVDMKNNKFKSNKYRQGSILGLMIVIGICLALLGMAMLQLGFGARVNSAISVSSITAREAADAGVAKALYSMNAVFPNTNWASTDSAVLPNSNASYEYTISSYGENYLITSKGISDRGQKVIYAVTGLTNFFDVAILVSDRIELKEDSFIDGYDSSLGLYGVNGNLLGSPHVKIGTTYAGNEYRIFLRNDVVVNGEVLVGPGGKVEEIIWDQATPGATTGPRYAMPYIPPIIDINIPSVWDVDLGNLDASVFDPNYIIDGTGAAKNFLCNNITIPNGSYLIILGDPNLGITGTLDLNQGSQIVVEDEPWSSVKIFLYGELNVGNGAWINNQTRIPNNFWLFGVGTSPAGERWIINNSGYYYGVYYGPNALIDVRQSAVFFGFILGREFTLAQSSQVHYDVFFSRNHNFDTGYAIDRWWEETNP
jgi:hypothetical protein